MFVAAVTGTDGKTSTVEFSRQLLTSRFDHPVAVGSLGETDGTARWPTPFFLSRPGAWCRYLDELALDHDAAVVEAFSSGLALREWDGTEPDVAVCTTFGQDHGDIHAGREGYARAKLRLFDTVLRPRGHAVVHADNPLRTRIESIASMRGHSVTVYGTDGDVRLVSRRPRPDGRASLQLVVFGQRLQVDTGCSTAFLIDNQLAALAVAVSAGVDPIAAVAGLAHLAAPPGRWDVVTGRDGWAVVVDHAHTPTALSAALCAAREQATRRVILVFGAGGDRDVGKRAQLGRVAAVLADMVVLTDDNPRNEDPASIRTAVRAGCPDAVEIAGRAAAIEHAVGLLGAGDVLVVAGRGAEQYQQVGEGSHPLDDRQVVLESVQLMIG